MVQVFGQLRPLIGEHEKDERRVETGHVFLRQILDVDELDEVDEEVDLRLEIGDVGHEMALGHGVVGRQFFSLADKVFQREDERSDKHIRVNETAINRLEEFLRCRRILFRQNLVEYLERLNRSQLRKKDLLKNIKKIK